MDGNVNAEVQDRSTNTKGSQVNHVTANVDVAFETENDQESRQRCTALKGCCAACSKPLLTEFNPLPPHARCTERCLHAFLCPPHGRIGACLLLLLMFAMSWATLIGLTDPDALPGGNLFSLLVLFMACWVGGYLIALIKLPPLLGMLLVGGLLNNVPYISVAKDIEMQWSSSCRSIALAVILTRAGLGLDPAALRRLSWVVLRLAFSPCLVETLTDGIAAHLLLGLPWVWSIMLGFVIAAVSPAVVVPSLLSLSERGYGLDKGIPTLVIAAASVDDVLAITGFGVTLAIAFSSGDLVWTLFKGPLEAVVGVAFGTVYGILLWFLPQKSSKHRLFGRGTLLVGGALMALFGFKSRYVHWDGSGPLAVLALAFVAALRWRKDTRDFAQLLDVVNVLWMLLQPLLFGLIGAEINVTEIQPSTVGLGIATLAIGLGMRMVTSFIVVCGTDLNLKERFFIPLAWLPKATVQAAVGAVAFDTAVEKNRTELLDYGKQVLTLAVLSILLTAPLGAAAIAISGPRLLSKGSEGGKKTRGEDQLQQQVTVAEPDRDPEARVPPPAQPVLAQERERAEEQVHLELEERGEEQKDVCGNPKSGDRQQRSVDEMERQAKNADVSGNHVPADTSTVEIDERWYVMDFDSERL